MKILTIVGARPQFIKAASVSNAIRGAGHEEFLLHTGQHYDYEMSQIFFDELGLPKPDLNLGIGSGTHGQQTGEMIIGIEQALIHEKPDWVLVYGDTNSTLAGAVAAVKLCIPVAHVEAGLRSFNREMPEEHNRVLTDHCSDLLLCPTQTAVANLASEGITVGVHFVGDVMLDAVFQFGKLANEKSTILQQLEFEPKEYVLATIHRPQNTDHPERLETILQTLLKIDRPVVLPLHPRTRSRLSWQIVQELGGSNVKLVDPLGYLDMLMLEQHASIILTDSGGVQKEAFFFAVPCITLRTETEWDETVRSGWNFLVGTDQQQILQALNDYRIPKDRPAGLFGDGRASGRILKVIETVYPAKRSR